MKWEGTGKKSKGHMVREEEEKEGYDWEKKGRRNGPIKCLAYEIETKSSILSFHSHFAFITFILIPNSLHSPSLRINYPSFQLALPSKKCLPKTKNYSGRAARENRRQKYSASKTDQFPPLSTLIYSPILFAWAESYSILVDLFPALSKKLNSLF